MSQRSHTSTTTQIMNSRAESNGMQYLIHFPEFSKSDWIDSALVVQDNKENRTLKAQMEQTKESHTTTTTTSSAASTRDKKVSEEKSSGASATKSSSSSTRKRKRTYQPKEKKNKRSRSDEDEQEDEEEEEDEVVQTKIEIPLPSALKSVLLEDYKHCSDKKQEYPLPVSTSLDTLISNFITHLKDQQQNTEETASDGELQIVESVLQGVKEYFNAVLRKALLYPCEKKSHDTYFKKSNIPSNVYGLEHLLRFYVKLPQYLSRMKVGQEGCAVIKDKSVAFLEWLEKSRQA
jgi:mortality factor 4-like protein 1